MTYVVKHDKQDDGEPYIEIDSDWVNELGDGETVWDGADWCWHVIDDTKDDDSNILCLCSSMAEAQQIADAMNKAAS